MPDETPERQQRGMTADWRPIPDPTTMTLDAQNRALRAERDYTNGQFDVIRERLRGIDIATSLLNETVNRVPTDLQTAIGRLNDLLDERFISVDLRFQERDVRSDRESRDNKVAVDAAFAAQKEAAAKQDESNAKAIDKSERATNDTISKLGDLLDALNAALTDKIDDVKLRLTTVESLALGIRQAESDRHQSIGSTTAILLAVAAFLSVIVVAAIATHGFSK